MRTTTRCWGLVLVLGSFVPGTVAAVVRAEQSVPQTTTPAPPAAPPPAAPSSAPVPPAAPTAPAAPTQPAATISWTVELRGTTALDLATTADRFVVLTRDDDEPSELTAYDATSGKEMWSSSIRGWQEIVASETEVIGAVGTKVIALDERSGKELWQVDPAISSPSLAVAGGWLVVAGANGVAALTREGGGTVWKRDDLAASASVVVAGSVAVVATADRWLYGIDLTSGAERWRVELATPAIFIGTGGGVVYVTTREGALCAFRTAGGRNMFCFSLRVPAVGPPILAGDVLYAGLLDNSVRAFDRESGAQRRPVELGQRAVAAPILVGTSVVVPVADGVVVRIGDKGRVDRIVTPAQPVRVRVLRVNAASDGKSLALMTSVPSGTVSLTRVELPPVPEAPVPTKPAVPEAGSTVTSSPTVATPAVVP